MFMFLRVIWVSRTFTLPTFVTCTVKLPVLVRDAVTVILAIVVVVVAVVAVVVVVVADVVVAVVAVVVTVVVVMVVAVAVAVVPVVPVVVTAVVPAAMPEPLDLQRTISSFLSVRAVTSFNGS